MSLGPSTTAQRLTTAESGTMYSLEDIRENLAVAKQHREATERTINKMRPLIDAIVEDYRQEIAATVYGFSEPGETATD